jgi:hypothetical protein
MPERSAFVFDLDQKIMIFALSKKATPKPEVIACAGS